MVFEAFWFELGVVCALWTGWDEFLKAATYDRDANLKNQNPGDRHCYKAAA